MAVLTSQRLASVLGALDPRSLLARLGETLRRRRAYYKAVRELRALSERELEDLGISRRMISRVALEAAHGRKHWRRTG